MIDLKRIEELRKLSCVELMSAALQTKIAKRGNSFALCSIMNAKSGQCSEDCRFCVQSAHYATAAPVYPLVAVEQVVAAAREAKAAGADHFSIVTSGRGLRGADLEGVIEMVAAVRAEVGIKVCASLGILAEADFGRLKAAGMSRYHHNLETSAEYFDTIVSTHTFAERIATIEAAQAAGLEVCAGGIFGLGESEADRVSLALTLRRCGVDSVPLNFLLPQPGTPLAGQVPLGVGEILRAIALYRLILPEIPIRLAAGRETALPDFLSSCFMAGADGMMIGGYLTTRGRSVARDREFVAAMQALWSA